MNFNLLDNITITCLTLGEEDESLDTAVHNPSIDDELVAIEDDPDGPKAGLLKLSAEEIKDFVSEMENPTRTPAAVANALAISARCSDVTPGVASLKACVQLSVTKSEELGKLGTCAAIAKLLQTHGSERDIALQAFGALIGLCQHRGNILLMEKVDMTAQIVRIMQMHGSNIDIVSWGTNVILAYLRDSTGDGKYVASSFLNDGVIEELLKVVDPRNPCSSSAKVVENVCKALMLLCPASSTATQEQINKLHPSINLSDIVVALDGTANIVQLDGEPVSESIRTLLQKTREHFHAALLNALQDKPVDKKLNRSNSSSSVHSAPSHPGSQPAINSPGPMELRVSKADLLNVVTTLLSDSLQTTESNGESKIRSFDDIFGNSRALGKARTISTAAQSAVKTVKKLSPVVDKSKVMAFRSALNAALSDEEKSLSEEEVEVEDEAIVMTPENDSVVTGPAADTPGGKGLDHNISMEGTVTPTYPLRAESHHSIRFDVPVSLNYRRDAAPAVGAKKSKKTDRATGNLYFADLQYSMGMAKCAAYFDSLAHKEYMRPPGLDDSTSSMYSVMSTRSNVNDENEDLDGGKVISERRLKRCIERFRVAVSLDPEHVDGMFALAILLCSDNDSLAHSEEAEQLFKDIIALEPEYPKCYYNLGHVFFTRGQYKDSLSCFESALEIESVDMEARVYKALCLTQLGGNDNISAAMNEYRAILSIDSNNYLALFNLGVLLAKMDDFSGAIFTFQTIIMNDPENVDALCVLAKSFQMRADTVLADINKSRAQNGGSVNSGFVPEHAAVIEDLRRSLR